MSYDGGRPKVWVGPLYHRAPIETKIAFAETAACFFLAGDDSSRITYPIFDGTSGKQVATWKFTRLEVE